MDWQSIVALGIAAIAGVLLLRRLLGGGSLPCQTQCKTCSHDSAGESVSDNGKRAGMSHLRER
jgi:hypothetical protein